MKLWEKTDMDGLRSWLDRRAASLKKARLPHEGVWRELSSHYEPDLGRALDDDGDPEDRSAAPRDAKLMSSTPRTELHRMAAAMKSGTANESRQWFRLRLREENDGQAEDPAWKRWLDSVTRTMSTLLDRSNAYAGIGQIFQHVCLFGTSAAVVTGEHPEDTLDVRVLDEGSYWIGASRSGRVDTLLRRLSMTARELEAEFGAARLPDAAKDAIETGRDEDRYTIWNLICPNDAERFPDIAGGRPFVSIYWLESKGACGGEDTAGVIDQRSYGYNPILCPRWSVVDGLYGIGPGRIGMPEVKELYRLERDSLRGIAQRVDPPFAAPESMQGAINTYPGGITYYPESTGRDRAVHPLFENAPDVQAVEMKISQVEMRIRRVFYADLFNAILNTANNSGVQMTARQVEEMSGEKISLLGPVLTNLNHGLFDPLVDALWGVMLARGLVPEPPAGMEGADFVPEYVSTLHMRQQEEMRLGGITRFMGVATTVLKVSPDAAKKIIFDQILDEAALALAVPGSVMRSDKEVAEMRAAEAEAMRQAQEAAANAEMGKQIPGYADAAKTLSETPAGGGTMLESLVGAAGRTGMGGLG